MTAKRKTNRPARSATSPAGEKRLKPRVKPHRPLETELAALWREVLGHQDISVHDTFVQAGGDSLAAMRITTTIRQRYKVHVPLPTLLPDGTITSLASLIKASAAKGDGKLTPIARVSCDATVPATQGQRDLWTHHQAAPHSAVYSEILPIRLQGPLRTGVLRQCIERLVARHEPLRTALLADGEQLVQRIRREAEPVLAELDLTGLSGEAERNTALAQAMRWAGGRPFDLSAGPHLRAHLIRLAAQDHLLVLSTHRAAMDGWSANVLCEELATLYRSLATGHTPRPDPLRLRFADFAAWQQQQLDEDAFAAELDYWRHNLSGVPEQLLLPTDLPRPQRPSGQGALACTSLPGKLMSQVDALARTTGVTRYMVLLAAFQLLLARYAATDDIVVGTPVSGRTHPDTQRLVGYCSNMLPMRTRIDQNESFADLLARVRTTVLDACAHQGLPFTSLLRGCGIDTRSVTPLIQVALVPEDIYGRTFSLDDHLRGALEYYDLGLAEYDLTLRLMPDPVENGLRIGAEYRTDLFRAATIERLLGHLHTLLASAAARPHAAVADLEPDPDAGPTQLREGFHQPAAGRSGEADRRTT
ncbi:condensation domain-containing protein [Streptomyces sp. NPDC053431]|uniref:condensation domain-containing protein n=1 Tax=Streptomyces sp. NPDC053431 TaxID=3365703 RepID=UPI0037D10243